MADASGEMIPLPTSHHDAQELVTYPTTSSTTPAIATTARLTIERVRVEDIWVSPGVLASLK